MEAIAIGGQTVDPSRHEFHQGAQTSAASGSLLRTACRRAAS
jgi:hypothetical protein